MTKVLNLTRELVVVLLEDLSVILHCHLGVLFKELCANVEDKDQRPRELAEFLHLKLVGSQLLSLLGDLVLPVCLALAIALITFVFE